MTNSGTFTKTLKIRNKFGIHARPAALIVKTSNKFTAKIMLEKDGNTASGNSIIGLLTLEGSPGSKVKVTASGADAAEALSSIEELFKNNFLED